MSGGGLGRQSVARGWIARAFGYAEDIIYIVLGVLLACIALALLLASGGQILHGLTTGTLTTHVTELLDQILLTLLTVELLYTVQVSFREHALVPEPFLLVGLIAGIRRILLLTAEYGELHEKTEAALHCFVIELAVLTVMVVALVLSLVLLRRSGSAIRDDHV